MDFDYNVRLLSLYSMTAIMIGLSVIMITTYILYKVKRQEHISCLILTLWAILGIDFVKEIMSILIRIDRYYHYGWEIEMTLWWSLMYIVKSTLVFILGYQLLTNNYQKFVDTKAIFILFKKWGKIK